MTIIRWTSAKGGLWGDAANWTGGAAPGPADDAVIAGAGAGTIGVFAPASVRTLLFDAPAGMLALHAAFRLGVEMEIQAGQVRLDSGGTIEGGLVADLDRGLRSQGGTLSGVSYQGSLALTQPGALLTIAGGITLAGTAGAGRASLLLTGAGSELAVSGSQTLNHATLDMSVGPPGRAATGLCLVNPASGGATLTLGADFAVVETGAFAGLHAGTATGDTIVNQGSITAARAGGTLTLDGASFTNAGSIAISNGATLLSETALINTGHLAANPSLAGQGATRMTFEGPVTNTGTILAAAGQAIFSEDVQGAGHLLIGAAGTLSLLAGAVATQTVDFLSATGALTLANPSVFDAPIAGFAGADRIDLANVVSNGATFAHGILTLSEGATPVAALHFEGSYTRADFIVGTDNVGGTAVTLI